MAEIIDLATLPEPDCDGCNEPTKFVVGKTFDVEGPGRVGALYGCGNRRRKERCDRIMRYFLRVARYEPETHLS